MAQRQVNEYIASHKDKEASIIVWRVVAGWHAMRETDAVTRGDWGNHLIVELGRLFNECLSNPPHPVRNWVLNNIVANARTENGSLSLGRILNLLTHLDMPRALIPHVRPVGPHEWWVSLPGAHELQPNTRRPPGRRSISPAHTDAPTDRASPIPDTEPEAESEPQRGRSRARAQSAPVAEQPKKKRAARRSSSRGPISAEIVESDDEDMPSASSKAAAPKALKSAAAAHSGPTTFFPGDARKAIDLLPPGSYATEQMLVSLPQWHGYREDQPTHNPRCNNCKKQNYLCYQTGNQTCLQCQKRRIKCPIRGEPLPSEWKKNMSRKGELIRSLQARGKLDPGSQVAQGTEQGQTRRASKSKGKKAQESAPAQDAAAGKESETERPSRQKGKAKAAVEETAAVEESKAVPSRQKKDKVKKAAPANEESDTEPPSRPKKRQSRKAVVVEDENTAASEESDAEPLSRQKAKKRAVVGEDEDDASEESKAERPSRQKKAKKAATIEADHSVPAATNAASKKSKSAKQQEARRAVEPAKEGEFAPRPSPPPPIMVSEDVEMVDDIVDSTELDELADDPLEPYRSALPSAPSSSTEAAEAATLSFPPATPKPSPPHPPRLPTEAAALSPPTTPKPSPPHPPRLPTEDAQRPTTLDLDMPALLSMFKEQEERLDARLAGHLAKFQEGVEETLKTRMKALQRRVVIKAETEMKAGFEEHNESLKSEKKSLWAITNIFGQRIARLSTEMTTVQQNITSESHKVAAALADVSSSISPSSGYDPRSLRTAIDKLTIRVEAIGDQKKEVNAKLDALLKVFQDFSAQATAGRPEPLLSTASAQPSLPASTPSPSAEVPPTASVTDFMIEVEQPDKALSSPQAPSSPAGATSPGPLPRRSEPRPESSQDASGSALVQVPQAGSSETDAASTDWMWRASGGFDLNKADLAPTGSGLGSSGKKLGSHGGQKRKRVESIIEREDNQDADTSVDPEKTLKKARVGESNPQGKKDEDEVMEDARVKSPNVSSSDDGEYDPEDGEMATEGQQGWGWVMAKGKPGKAAKDISSAIDPHAILPEGSRTRVRSTSAPAPAANPNRSTTKRTSKASGKPVSKDPKI